MSTGHYAPVLIHIKTPKRFPNSLIFSACAVLILMRTQFFPQKKLRREMKNPRPLRFGVGGDFVSLPGAGTGRVSGSRVVI